MIARTEVRRLREVIADLSRDQQLVLASQVYVDMGAGEFCARHGWSVEKYRKVAQRARGKLRVLVEEYERGERCRRLEADLLAMCAGVAEDRGARAGAGARGELPDVRADGRRARPRGALGRGAAPDPGARRPRERGLAVKLAGVVDGGCGGRRAIVRHPLAEIGAGGGAGVAGGSLGGRRRAEGRDRRGVRRRRGGELRGVRAPRCPARDRDRARAAGAQHQRLRTTAARATPRPCPCRLAAYRAPRRSRAQPW